MKSISLLLAAGVSALALASAAQAADLIIDTAPAPIIGVVDTGSSWDGPFVGVFAGYGWADLDTDAVLPPPGLDLSPEGWLLGVDAGANFTLTDGIVAGIVGDIAWADISDSFEPVAGTTLSSTIDWQGSVRGRIGFDGGAFMPYLTAGLAFAHNTIDFDDGVTPASDDQTHIGWTAGAGVEFAVSDNMSIDALYRYSDYGTATYGAALAGGADLGITSHQVSVGLNFGF